MKVHFQKFVSLVVVFVISVGLLIVPASANVVDGLKYNATTLWDFLSTGTTDYNFRDAIGAYTGNTPLEKYADMVDKMITGLGTDTIAENGYLIPVLATSYYIGNSGRFVSFSPGATSSVTFSGSSGYPHFVDLSFVGKLPISGNYKLLMRSSSGAPVSSILYSGVGSSLGTVFGGVAGADYSFSMRFNTSGFLDRLYTLSVSMAFEVMPVDYTPDGFTKGFGGGAGRPGNFDTSKGFGGGGESNDIKFGVKAEDGSVSVAGNVGSLFNEKNTTYYNPQTNSYQSAKNWTYDYSDRSYTFDTDNSGSGKVVYGDDIATVTLKDSNGNVINYNYNYMVGGGSTGGGGTGGGGTGGGGSSGGGIFGKLGELLGSILNGITTIIGAALEKILDGLITLVDSIVSKLGAVVTSLLGILDELPKMLGGFTTFLSSAFSFLPPEITTIFTFGILAVVLVGILKLFLK